MHQFDAQDALDASPGMAHSAGMGIAVPFPETQPAGYAWLDDEPRFDPERDLQLEAPSEIVLLEDLGYGAEEIQAAMKDLPVDGDASVLLKQALQRLAVNS